MAKKTSKTVIGIFVVSAIAMLIAGVVILGGGEMFKETRKFVMFFDTSIKGLRVGAPVTWSGVEIGSVSSITLEADRDALTMNIPVVIEVDPSLLTIKGKGSIDSLENVKRMIERGLRSQLTLQSMVTGQLMIEVDYHPDTPVRLTGIKSEYPEIPTLPSGMAKFAQKIKNLPIDEIAKKLISVLNNIDEITGDPAIKEVVQNVGTASQNLDPLVLNADRLITELRTKVGRISDSLVATSEDAQEVLGDSRKLVNNVDDQVQPVSDKVQDAMVSFQQAMDQSKTTLAGINGFVGENSNTRRKLNRALDEIADAAQSMNSLMDYIERHPEAVLKGKGNGGG